MIPDDDVAAPERVEREQMAARLDAGAGDRDVARQLPGARRAMQAAEAAAVRQAVSAAPPSSPRSRPVALSSTITSALIAGSPLARFSGKTLTSLTPEPSSPAQ